MENKKEFWVLGHKISPHNVSGNYDMVTGETPPNVPGPPPHYHSKLSELFFVLEGKMEFNLDGKSVILNKGESIDLSPNCVHTFSNAGNTSCKWLNVHSPKGFLSFFENFGIDAHEENAAEKSVDDSIIQNVMQKAADYDMLIKI
ncbi:MAG: cupin domain-containing protein [Chitinophagales bacterium]